MINNIIRIVILCFLPLIGICQETSKDTIKVFYLGGQSNMDGKGAIEELPDSLNQTFDNIWIFHGNPSRKEKGGNGIWEELKPGHGAKFSTDGNTNQLSNKFGVELSFAKKIQALYPNDRIAIIKYSKGGTPLDTATGKNSGTWEPDFKNGNGINQYDYFLKTIKGAFSVNDINNDGIMDYLLPCGIIWMQGESDSYQEEVAMRYYSNLKKLMELMRASLHDGHLPVVIGKISDSLKDKKNKKDENYVSDGIRWDYGDLVQFGQEKFVREDNNAAIVRKTKYYNYSDISHYDTEGYILLGEEFAKEVYNLNMRKK